MRGLYARLADFRGANLSNADLTKSNLRQCALFKTWMKNSDFSGANLQNIKGAQSQMQESKFRGAKLEGADLSGARMEETDFEGASLQVANLSRAVLKNSNLKGADLKGANLRYTTGLTKDQIESALIDKTTLLPSHLKVKWKSEKEFECHTVEKKIQ